MERVILVGLRERNAKERASLDELKGLTETAGGLVVGTYVQAVDRPNPATLIGSGKVEELQAAVVSSGAATVIFDHDLTPAQQRNLEDRIPAMILDRTRLILDIFATRARTREGSLQVELAQLEYLLPRLTGRGRAFSQQVGRIGTRGPGERALEYERRRIRDRIARLKGSIEGIRKEREVQRKRRLSVPFPMVALIGYTNVGKSTLLNALAGAKVYADDRLFATLDPTTRRVKLPSGGWALWTDTVGFIQKLPTTLIAAFRSTLEEAAHADCLVHVVDAASEHRDEQAAVVDKTLEKLDAADLPRIVAYNKADALSEDARDALLGQGQLLVSAAGKQGLGELLERVEQVLNKRWVRRVLVLDPRHARLEPEIYRTSQVVSRTHHDGRTELEVRVTPENFARLRRLLS